MSTENFPEPDVFSFSADSTGFYRRNFHYQGTLAIGRTGQALGATLRRRKLQQILYQQHGLETGVVISKQSIRGTSR